MAFEIAFLLFIGILAVVGTVAIGRPMVTAYLEKTRYKYRELGSEAEQRLDQRVKFLESEVTELKRQVASLQETSDFLSKEQETIIKLKSSEKKQI